MAGASASGMFKFLKPSMRPQPSDIKAAVGWGVAAATAGIYLVQPFGWIKRTFIDKPEEQN
ncbi:hypothetical protein BVRB_2g038800 [Beta vulgaris subsp. vulgaris]|nr:hypothetical protein BVRB_2g038800 [Beta vulgaris subsp. vulgaris]